MQDLKILVNIYYPPVIQIKNRLMDNPIYIGINGGSGLRNDEWCQQHVIFDDTGDNISDKNRILNEMTSIYWAWKNYSKIGSPDYIGFNHYRRFFHIYDITDYRDYDIIVGKPIWSSNKVSLAVQYKIYHNIDDLQKCVDIVRSHDKTTGDRFRNYMVSTGINFAPCNMFIMKKDLFFRWCGFIFPIIDDLMKSIDMTGREDYQKRAICFLVERLFGFWCNTGDFVIKQVNIDEHLEYKNNNLDERQTPIRLT